MIENIVKVNSKHPAPPPEFFSDGGGSILKCIIKMFRGVVNLKW